jgi:hypothetical protein
VIPTTMAGDGRSFEIAFFILTFRRLLATCLADGLEAEQADVAAAERPVATGQ